MNVTGSVNVKEAQSVAIGTTNHDTNINTATNVGVMTNKNNTNIKSTKTAAIGTNLKDTNVNKAGAVGTGGASITMYGAVDVPSSSEDGNDCSDDAINTSDEGNSSDN